MHELIDLTWKPVQVIPFAKDRPRQPYAPYGGVPYQFKIDDRLMWNYPEKTVREFVRIDYIVVDGKRTSEYIYDELPEDEWYYEVSGINAPKRLPGEDYDAYDERTKIKYKPDYFEANLLRGPEQSKAKGFNKWINEIQVGDFVKCRGQRNNAVWKMIMSINADHGTFVNMQFTKPINDPKYAHAVGTQNSIHDIKEKYDPKSS